MEPHFATIWESVADATPDLPALVQADVRRTWGDYDDRAARLAATMAAAGVGAGAKVAQYLYNCPEYCESFFAALKLRAVPVNVNYRYLDDELLYLLDNADAEVLLFHASLAERVARVRDRTTTLKLLIEVDDTAGAGAGTVDPAISYDEALRSGPAPRTQRDGDDITMIFTGGTTGMPKGVMTKIAPQVEGLFETVPPLFGLAPLRDAEGFAPAARQLREEGRQFVSLPACPLMHGTGLGIGVLPAMTFGGRIVFLANKGLDVDELWSLVEAERVGSITIVGDAFARPLLRGLQERPTRDLSSLQLICSAGAMFATEIKAGLLEHLPQTMILDYIAATEGLMGVSISTKDNPAPTGRFLPAPGVTVLDEDGMPIAPGAGTPGMVAVPGSIPEGYYKDETKTAATFRQIGGVRYSIPGDWATIEADGTISLLGRGSQCINTGGEKVYPEEVEEAIKRHEAVDDCLVFGVPDERFGQRVVGVASLTPGASATVDDVLADVRGRLSAYKVPRLLAVVDEVPRAANGKADYPAARKLFEASSV